MAEREYWIQVVKYCPHCRSAKASLILAPTHSNIKNKWLLGIFTSLSRILTCIFLSLVVSLPGLGIREILASSEKFGSAPLVSFSLSLFSPNNLRSSAYRSAYSFKSLREFCCESIWGGLFFRSEDYYSLNFLFS